MPFLVFVWWLLLVWGAGWLAFPLARRVLGHALPDGGLAIGRIAFLALWSVLAFWLGHVGVPVALSAWVYGVLALLCLALWWGERKSVRKEWKARRRAILSVEAAFLVTFLVFWTLRGFWSDTSGTNGEKGMDSALIASLTRAQQLPPPNPFSAGARLESYYILGHLEAALLTRATGTTTRWSYNLMCATLPALCFPALFSLGAGLTRRRNGGLFIALAVLGLGTLQPLSQWLHPENFPTKSALGLDAMAVSRVQPNAINEFPWFTFNHGDLHAHLFDFPLEIALMALAWAMFRSPDERRRRVLLGACSFFLGAQILTNTWDFPAFALLVGLSFGFAPRTRSEGIAVAPRPALEPANGTQGRAAQPEPVPSQRGSSRAKKSKTTKAEPAVAAPQNAVAMPRSAKESRQAGNVPSPQNAVTPPGNKARAKTMNGVPSPQNALTTAASEGDQSPGRVPSPQNAVADAKPTHPRSVPSNALWPRRVLWIGLALCGAIGLSLPYLLGINTVARGPGLLVQPASPLREWLLLRAPFLAAWWAFGVARMFRSNRRAWLGLGAMGALLLLAAWLGQSEWGYPRGLEVQPIPTPDALSAWFGALNPARLVIPLVLASAWLALRGIARERGALRFAAILALAGLVALLWSETTWAGFLGDPKFPGFSDAKRQDTTFKFGLQVWFLWGTAASVGAYWTLKRWPLALRLAWVPLLVVMATSSLADTLWRARGLDQSQRQNWDGWAHLRPNEQDAARWLELHAAPGQNILEAEQKEGGDYSDYTRYAQTTGIPTIIGPQAHSFQWSPSPLRPARNPGESAEDFLGRRAGVQWDEIFKRKSDARAAFTTTNAAGRRAILHQYGVRYVVWGELERAQYGEASRALLERDLRLAARFGFDDNSDPVHRVEVWQAP